MSKVHESTCAVALNARHACSCKEDRVVHAKLHQACIDRLETELNEANAKIKQMHKDLGCEFLDPNGTIWEHAARVQKELEEALDCIEKHCDRNSHGNYDVMIKLLKKHGRIK